MITVKATREGLVGHCTASGYVIDKVVPFVALPSVNALFRFIRIEANGKSCKAIVLDIGPWNTRDDAYVFQPATDTSIPDAGLPERRPQDESGIDKFGRVTNGAGIDLSEKVWSQLEMQGNGKVSWEFI